MAVIVSLSCLRRRNSLFILTVVVVVVVMLMFGLPRSKIKPVKGVVSRDKSENVSKNDMKLVLLWTEFFRETKWVTANDFKWCPVNTCLVTEDKSLAETSDALLFHERDIQGAHLLPKIQRPRNQRWVWLSQETYMNFDTDMKPYKSVFNWTMTYRRDSDVVIAYGAVRRRSQLLDSSSFHQSLQDEAKKRSKLVAIRISNCNEANTDRINYLKKLQQFIPVDVLGACGEPCNADRNNCDNEYMKRYKFYLSFENSHCTDYITEKFWLPLQFWHNVPIVMGGSSKGDYEAIAPPKSYIHVDNFGSVKEMAEYLKKLDKNESLYNEYFRWRLTHEYEFPGYCYLCAALHDQTLPEKTYTDLEEWYHKDHCSSEHPVYS